MRRTLGFSVSLLKRKAIIVAGKSRLVFINQDIEAQQRRDYALAYGTQYIATERTEIIILASESRQPYWMSRKMDGNLI